MNHKILIAVKAGYCTFFAFQIKQASYPAVFTYHNFRSIAVTEVANLNGHALFAKFPWPVVQS